MRRAFLLAAALLAVSCVVATAQEITGQIRGTVTDATGAVVPGARITITISDRGQVFRETTTDAAGTFTAPLLPVATYTVTVEAKGFKKFVKTGIVLNVSDRIVVDAALQTGASSETVTVEAAPLDVNLQSSAVEGVITGAQVRELPLNNRNYEQLVALQPGVSSNAADSLYVGTTNPSGGVNIVPFSINGNRQSQNNWTIDGADNVDHGSNITLLVYPSVDAISEFKLSRSNYSPEFGRSASGQINVVTRSGSNGYHGNLYEFFRNDAINANSSFNNHFGLPKSVLRYNDFGGTFGGPILKDKTYFFFSEEVRRVRTPVSTTALLPSALQRQGIFQGPVCTSVDADGNCLSTGTTIDPANINPLSAAYLTDLFNKLPLPNSDGLLASQSAGIFDYREELLRVDHLVNSKIALAGRIIIDHIPTVEPFGLFGPQSNAPGVANTKTDSPGRQYMGRITMQIKSNMYNEAGYAYSYGGIVSDPTGTLSSKVSTNVSSALKLPYPRQLNRIPNLLFDDGFDSFVGFGQYRDFNYNHNAFDNFSWSRGKHAMKFGFSVNIYNKKENAAGDNAGNFEFDSTNQPDGGSAQEQDFANFLLGYASSDFLQAPIDVAADTKQKLWEFYGQDEWRVRSNLTLTYGVRYSFFQTPTDGGHRLTSFDPAVYNPANAPQLTSTGRLVLGTGDPLNGIIVGGVSSPYGSSVTRQQKLDFAPRFGLAWDPWGKGTSSVRAGFGIFYDSAAAGVFEDNTFNNPPVLGNADFGGGVFINNVAGLGASPSTVPPGLWTSDPRWNTPYSEQWNLDFQRTIANGWLVDVGYVGNRGIHLIGVWDINQVAPGAAVAAGLIAPGQVYPAGTTNARKLNALRPFVGYAGIGQISPRFYSNYNGLQTSLQKRFGGNGLLNVNYTWSKDLTTNQSDRSSGVQYSYCIPCEYGRASLDRKHIFTANGVYDLPFFRSRKDAVGKVLGGVELSGILTANSGLPFTALDSRSLGDPAASGLNGVGSPNNGRVASPRPNQISDPNQGAPHTWAQFFNTAAFAPVTVGGAPGNAHRGSINGPGLVRFDLALLKNFAFTERFNLQFRAEAFNVFNHTNFSSIDRTRSSPTFGQVTATRDPRVMQLALKLGF